MLRLPPAAYHTWNGTLLEGRVCVNVTAELRCESLCAGRDTQLLDAVEAVKKL